MANGSSRPDSQGTADGGPPRHFVNHMRVGLSLSDIHLDLATTGATTGARAIEAPALWRFVTTPDHLHTMHEDLGAAIDRYQSRFGRIRVLRTAPPAIVIEGDGIEGGGKDGDG